MDVSYDSFGNLEKVRADQIEEAGLLLYGHRVHEGLVAVPEIRREPSWSGCDCAGWPGAVWDVNWLEWSAAWLKPSGDSRASQQMEQS